MQYWWEMISIHYGHSPHNHFCFSLPELIQLMDSSTVLYNETSYRGLPTSITISMINSDTGNVVRQWKFRSLKSAKQAMQLLDMFA